MKIVIVGAGIGGLACAIACRQEDLDVILIERAPEILPVSVVFTMHVDKN
jgi:salicylate hydroxylase